MNVLKELSTCHIKAILDDNFLGVLFHPLSVKPPIAKTNDFAHVNSLLSGSFPPVLKVHLQLFKTYQIPIQFI